MDGQYYNLWSMDNDNTTVPNDDVVIKSVYDPSPVGYSLPASNAFTGFTTTGQNVGDWPNPITPEDKAKLNVKGDLDNGWYFYTKPNKQGGTVFFPTCGHRSHNFGSLTGLPMGGCCWVACPGTTYGGRCLDFGSGHVYQLYVNGNRSDGMSVRSAEERDKLVKIKDLRKNGGHCLF